jgi:putative molybdopterin biosynthesis protein
VTAAGEAVGARLRLARQSHGLSQQQLAGMAGVTRQALSAVESGHSDPSLRVALAISRALGVTVEELFGPGEPAQPVEAIAVADPGEPGARVTLAAVGDGFVALPLRGDTAARAGFASAGGLVIGADRAAGEVEGGRAADAEVSVQPIGPTRPTLVVAGCDPALPLLETVLSLLDPPVGFAWWPCGSGEALGLAARGLVHAAGVHAPGARAAGERARSARARSGYGDIPGGGYGDIPGGAEVVGFSAWREGLVVKPDLAVTVHGLDDVARLRIPMVNREPGAEARRLLDAERERLGLEPSAIPGYDTRAAGHMQVASAVAAGVAGVGVASEPVARAYGLSFIPWADERFDLVLPAKHLGSREVQGLLRVLSSPWLLSQLASIPGYDPSTCGERLSSK